MSSQVKDSAEGSSAPSICGKGVFVKTFGCQMNEYDTEKVVALLSSDYKPVASPEEASFVFVNTCSVREKAESNKY